MKAAEAAHRCNICYILKGVIEIIKLGGLYTQRRWLTIAPASDCYTLPCLAWAANSNISVWDCCLICCVGTAKT